jgi:hypothetical protein
MAASYLTTHTMWCIEVYWKNCLTVESSTKALFSENAAEVGVFCLYDGIFGCCFRSLTENIIDVSRMNKSLDVTLTQRVIFI